MTTLREIVDSLGSQLVRILHEGVGLDDGVPGIAIHDPFDSSSAPPGTLVLGIAQSPGPALSSLMAQLARDGNSLAIKLTAQDHGRVAEEGERLGLSVLEIDSAASWTQVVSLLRSITDAASGDEGEQLGGVGAGDLFAVANAVSALVDAPVTIEDPQSRVIAYSAGQEDADEARMATILGRRIPQPYADKFRSEGIFLRLHRETAPIYLDDIGVDVLPRLAVAVRAGDEVLGSMWAAVRARPSAERVAAFGEAARFVAMHVLRHRAAADVRRGLHTDLMSLLLSGGPQAASAAGRLGLSGSCFRVMACGVRGGEAVDSEALLLRLSDTLALHLSLVQRAAPCAAVDRVLYAVLPTPTDPAHGRAMAHQVADGFLARLPAGLRAETSVAIGSHAGGLAAVPASRQDADHVLRLARGRPGAGRVQGIEEMAMQVLLARLADLAGDAPLIAEGPLAALAEHDRRHRTPYLDTLRAYLESFGDVPVAARWLNVHQNTFRYRLQRLQETPGLDLTDPDQRLSLLLQFRLLELRRDQSSLGPTDQ